MFRNFDGDIIREIHPVSCQDEQLSTAVITDDAGQIQNHYRYDAFGEEIGSNERISNRIWYTGQQYDGVTDQYYLRSRYYNPMLGRFMQEDLKLNDGLNLYAYCKNNPVIYYDPSGYTGTATSNNSCPPGAKIASDGVDENGYPERQLLNGEEWYEYLRETYGDENVQGSAYNLSSAELQDAIDKVYMAGVDDLLDRSKTGNLYNGGPRMTATVTQDGRVIISQNSAAVNVQSQKVAIEIFGDNVEFVPSGNNYVRPNMEANYGNHAETKGVYYLERDGLSTEGAKQISSHYSCDSCMSVQQSNGILNMTGYATDYGKQKRIDY